MTTRRQRGIKEYERGTEETGEAHATTFAPRPDMKMGSGRF